MKRTDALPMTRIHVKHEGRMNFLKKALIFLLCLACLPAMALAAPMTPYAPATMLRYLALTPAQQDLFDTLYAAAAQGMEEVAFPDGAAYADAEAALQALLTDCPELCALAGRYSIRYLQDAPNVALSATLYYDAPLSQQEALLTAAQALAVQAQGDSYARELFLYDALCGACVYDPAAPHPSSAYGALAEGRATCEGYARALSLLCRLAGIPCAMVTGDAWHDGSTEAHAWCVMNVGGEFVLCDPTWDDQDGLGVVTHWYFNLSERQMGADHWADGGFPLPACTTEELTWHAQQNRLVPREKDAAQAVMDAALTDFALSGHAVHWRFENPADAKALAADVEGCFRQYNSRHPEAAFSGAYSVSWSEIQGCVVIQRRD